MESQLEMNLYKILLYWDRKLKKEPSLWPVVEAVVMDISNHRENRKVNMVKETGNMMWRENQKVKVKIMMYLKTENGRKSTNLLLGIIIVDTWLTKNEWLSHQDRLNSTFPEAKFECNEVILFLGDGGFGKCLCWDNDYRQIMKKGDENGCIVHSKTLIHATICSRSLAWNPGRSRKANINKNGFYCCKIEGIKVRWKIIWGALKWGFNIL